MGREVNVLGTTLQLCSLLPKTGFLRDGYCTCNEEDRGLHTICAIMTDEFLTFSKAEGNDLSTPRPEYDFPGLKAGDQWCICLFRWIDAHQAGKAPNLVLEATNSHVLEYVSLDILEGYRV